MATLQAAQVFEGNIVTFPDASAHTSDAANETSDATPNEMPETKWTTLEMVDRYQVSDRTIQNWLKRIVDQCQVPDSSLRIQRGQEVEFTAYCVELLDGLIAYRQAHGPKKIAGWFFALAEKQKRTQSQTEETPTPSPPSEHGGELAIASNPFLNGIGADEAMLAIAPLESRLETLQTQKLERSQIQIELAQQLQSLAIAGYQQGILESEIEKDEFAAAYEEAAQEEILRIEREQRLEAIRAQAKKDIQAAYQQSKRLGNGSPS